MKGRNVLCSGPGTAGFGPGGVWAETGACNASDVFPLPLQGWQEMPSGLSHGWSLTIATFATRMVGGPPDWTRLQPQGNSRVDGLFPDRERVCHLVFLCIFVKDDQLFSPCCLKGTQSAQLPGTQELLGPGSGENSSIWVVGKRSQPSCPPGLGENSGHGDSLLPAIPAEGRLCSHKQPAQLSHPWVKSKRLFGALTGS